jgi:hypothetical protein
MELIRRKYSLMNFILDEYEKATDKIDCRAIGHLIRHNLVVSEEEERIEDIQLRIEKKRIEICRLEEQIDSSLPKGRDPTGERFIEKLVIATAVPESELDDSTEEYWSDWKVQKQLPLLNPIPYPIIWGSAYDLYWSSSNQQSQSAKKRKRSKQPRERVQVRFNGKELKRHKFNIYCDRRQLTIFKQFLEDYVTLKNTPDDQKFSGGLLALRSACLVWKKEPQSAIKRRNKKRLAKNQLSSSETLDAPWETYRLYLHCTYDTRLTTNEGTEEVRLEKLEKAQKSLELAEARVSSDIAETADPKETKKQLQGLKSKRTGYKRLQNSSPVRLDANAYKGNPDIVLGISFDRRQPATVVVFDKSKQKVLECQTTKALLKIRRAKGVKSGKGILKKQKEQCQLISRWRGLRKHNLIQRSEEQRQDKYRQSDSESNLGVYLDRLLASRIIHLAQRWHAGTIVLPGLGNIRESVESGIQAKAEGRFPNHKALQAKYAKQYRSEFHRWSYGRLIQYVKERAKHKGLLVLTGTQPKHGTEQEKALGAILSVYG